MKSWISFLSTMITKSTISERRINCSNHCLIQSFIQWSRGCIRMPIAKFIANRRACSGSYTPLPSLYLPITRGPLRFYSIQSHRDNINLGDDFFLSSVSWQLNDYFVLQLFRFCFLDDDFFYGSYKTYAIGFLALSI